MSPKLTSFPKHHYHYHTNIIISRFEIYFFQFSFYLLKFLQYCSSQIFQTTSLEYLRRHRFVDFPNLLLCFRGNNIRRALELNLGFPELAILERSSVLMLFLNSSFFSPGLIRNLCLYRHNLNALLCIYIHNDHSERNFSKPCEDKSE